ncbi:MAG: hypothetical protein KIT31_25455 [Deltaproteobacteria bacterium]|nr:hypothetical protein [Deltaproteobacteria bacterium]
MSRVPQPNRDAPASEWNVYADALQEAGDPRGELIALNGAVAKGMSPADRDAYVDRHREALFGPAHAHAGAFRVNAWHHLFPDDVAIRISPSDAADDVVRAFLASPLAEARTLAIAGVPAGGGRVDLTAAVAALAAQLPPSVRALRFVDERAAATTLLSSRDFDPDPNLVDFGDVSAFWGKAQLEDISFDVADSHQLALGEIEAPHLRHFALRNLRLATTYDNAEIVDLLGRAKFRDLRSFELRLVEEWGANIVADEDAYVPKYTGHESFEERMDEAEEGEQYDNPNWGPLRPLLETLKACPLERLTLTSFETTDSLFEVLAAVGFAPGLQVLDLSDSGTSNPAWFREHKALFSGVKRLVLERTSLTDEHAAQLADLGPEIQHSHSPGGATYRYVVGQE